MNAPTPRHIFISYAHADKHVAVSICTTLEANGIRCWIAPRDVLPGTEYAEAIIGAIKASRAMVLVLSNQSNQSPQVKREVERAASRALPIVPFRIEEVRLSESLEYYLSDHHWLDAFPPPIENHIRRLADTLRAISEKLQEPSQTPAVTAAQASASTPSVLQPPAAGTSVKKPGAALLEVRGLKKHFSVRRGLFGEKGSVRAVDDVSFSVMPKESFAVVGESGCGKTTLGRLILALEKPTAGRVLFQGRDLYALSATELRKTRRDLQVIFQDPYSSLNPRMTVQQIIEEPLIIHDAYGGPGERESRIKYLLDVCGIAESHLGRYPHEFSGGQRQRVGIARALALNPKLVVADEPVSALDVSIQAQILNLLKDLQRELELTYVFISHDFSVVRHLCSRIAVMYLGKIVELAESEALFNDPQHPYTEALLSAVPIPDPNIEKRRKRVLLSGDVPSPLKPPSGCHFHPRCRYAVESCKTEAPPLDEGKPAHWAACPVRPFAQSPSAAALTAL